MIRPETEAEVQRLLALGVGQRAVARELGIGRGTVDAIAQGRRPPDLSRLASVACADPWRSAERCRGCGRLMQLIDGSCPACAVETSRSFSAYFDCLPGPIGLALRPADYARYLEVVATRQRDGIPLDPDGDPGLLP